MFVKPRLEFSNKIGTNIPSTNSDQDGITGRCYPNAQNNNGQQHELNTSPAASCTTQKASKKREPEQSRNAKKKYGCGDCGLVRYDTVQEIKQHMMVEHGYVSQKRITYPESEIDEASQDSNEKSSPGPAMKQQPAHGPPCDDEQRAKSNSQSPEEPLTRTRKRKLQLEPSPPSDEEEEKDDFLKTVTLKSLTEKFQYEKPHKCSRKGCQYKFASFEVRDQHLRCHAENDSTPDPAADGSDKKATVPRKRFSFKCSQCDGKFDAWKPCLMHLWREHQIDLGMLRCPVCEKRFVYTVHVFKHLQTHRLNDAHDVACRVCGKKFVNTSQRSVHEALHRAKEPYGDEDELLLQDAVEKPRWYAERRCDICKHMFSNSKILSKHIKTVHLQIKPFVCNVCGYKCARKATLNIHIRQHSGLKPLTCKSCPFRTADPSALSYHERRHQNNKAYQCKTCGLRLVQPNALRGHIQTQHPQEYLRMKCTLCDYASINAQNLKRHQANHKAGLIKTHDEDSQPEPGNERGGNHRTPHGLHGLGVSGGLGHHPENAPEISSDCFLPLESVDSVVHDTGGITIPAAVVSLPAALSEETQFPI
uniref:C2H2-type domain-containing protein n=1 Tax=Anopheles quadriannulatus TaxID=34691 RepID=A0A182X8Z5_ANOQN